MKRLLLLVPLAGCPHGGAKSPAKNDLYGGLFEAQRQWTYDVTDADASYQVSCQVTDQRDFTDGTTTVITCDGEFGEGNPVLAGLWAADARGLWYLPDVEVEDLADLPSLP